MVPAAVLDPTRGRVLLSGGDDGIGMSNAVTAVALDTLTPSPVFAATRYDEDLGLRTIVFDPTRGAVVAFGGQNNLDARTETHGLIAGDAWARLGADDAMPFGLWSSAIYDPVGRAIVAFGGFDEGTTLKRLSSASGATWETIAADGPSARERHLAVYDSLQRRMIVLGGLSTGPSSTVLSDVWALSLDGSPPSWQGDHACGGGTRRPNRLGGDLHDPVGNRVVVVGGSNWTTGWIPDVWSLSLDGPPAWEPPQVFLAKQSSRRRPPSGRPPSRCSSPPSMTPQDTG